MVKVFLTERTCVHISHLVQSANALNVSQLFRLVHSSCNTCVTLENRKNVLTFVHLSAEHLPATRSGPLVFINPVDYNAVSFWLFAGYRAKHVIRMGAVSLNQIKIKSRIDAGIM